jgi:hypothetical protein
VAVSFNVGLAITFAVSTTLVSDEGGNKQRSQLLVDQAKEHAVGKPADQNAPRVAMNNCVGLRRGHRSFDCGADGLEKLLTDSRALRFVPLIRAPKVGDGRRP